MEFDAQITCRRPSIISECASKDTRPKLFTGASGLIVGRACCACTGAAIRPSAAALASNR
jgi:hypothetical protein